MHSSWCLSFSAQWGDLKRVLSHLRLNLVINTASPKPLLHVRTVEAGGPTRLSL